MPILFKNVFYQQKLHLFGNVGWLKALLFSSFDFNRTEGNQTMFTNCDED